MAAVRRWIERSPSITVMTDFRSREFYARVDQDRHVREEAEQKKFAEEAELRRHQIVGAAAGDELLLFAP